MKANGGILTFVFVFSLLGLALPCRAAQVLPPETGQALQKAIEEGRLQTALGSGWHLQSISVSPKKITIKIDEDGVELAVDLLPLQASEGEAARWFRIQPSGTEQGSAKWVALRDLGREVDALFEENPWKQAKKEDGSRKHVDGQEPGREGAGKGYFVGLGALQWLLLALAFGWGALFLRRA